MNKLLISLLLSFSTSLFATTITAQSWILADADGTTIDSKNQTEQRSIGSITKLATAMVVLDAGQNLNEYLGPYTRQQLIQMALIKSDNKAAIALCEHYRGGAAACINAMNTKAHDLEMYDTKFVEASGLSVMNVSTATDLIKLVRAAQYYREVVDASRTSSLRIHNKKRTLIVNNTNPLVTKFSSQFLVSKTGFINRAGGCIVMMIDTALGRRIVVLLGSKNTHTRIPEAQSILHIN
jgi:D-alanyl-D-alanine endopeptidase (penicillin-binding protein 7)